MSKVHKIGWLNVPGYVPESWNPIVGCSKISTGCERCYAERMALRLAKIGSSKQYDYVTNAVGWAGNTRLVDDALGKPLHWKKPRAIFVNSMGDLFHEKTPDEWILKVWNVMRACPQHLFIVLTKRAERMADFVPRIRFDSNGAGRVFLVDDPADGGGCPLGAGHHGATGMTWVWLGVTAENQEQADLRIPHLLSTPAAVRLVSCEPMVGAVNLR